MIMANDDMILSFIEGDKKLELSIKGYEFDEYFKQIKGEFDTSDQDSEWLMIKAVFSECGKQIECYDPSLEVCDLKYLYEQLMKFPGQIQSLICFLTKFRISMDGRSLSAELQT